MNRSFQNKKASPATTQVAADVSLEGNLIAAGDVWVNGSLKGSLKSEARVTVAENATVIADIEAESVTISGHLQGNVQAAGSVTVTSTGIVEGDITAKNITVEAGANLNGRLIMPQDSPASPSEE